MACNGGSALQPENLSRSVKTKDFRSDRKDTRVKQEAERQGTLPAPEGAKHWFVFVIRKMCDISQTNKKGNVSKGTAASDKMRSYWVNLLAVTSTLPVSVNAAVEKQKISILRAQ